MFDVLRILDANANRAREALRVMEEAARFVLNDADLTESLKHLRHDLVTLLLRFDTLPFWRDVKGDVGTDLTTPREAAREGVADVASAAGARLSEALRVMEEYGKVVDPAFAAGVERLRYRGYELDQRLNARLSGGRARGWRLCLLLTEAFCVNGWRATLEAALRGGADCVQVREKDMADAALLARVREIVAICRGFTLGAEGRHGATVIVNDRPDIALLAGADGVHLGQDDLPCRKARKLVGRRLLIGVSTSRIEEARRALEDGADYCGVGPMFPTTTKHKEHLAGPAYLREYLAWDRLPGLAIGGITPSHVATLVDVAASVDKAGCTSWGVAVSSAICGADDAEAATRAIRRGLECDRTSSGRVQSGAEYAGHG